jgi:hypothetical protein
MAWKKDPDMELVESADILQEVGDPGAKILVSLCAVRFSIWMQI